MRSLYCYSKVFSNFLFVTLFLINNSIYGQKNESDLWKNEPYHEFPMQSEAIELRTATSKHFHNGNGTLTAHLSAGQIHYWENGSWKTIYHTIVPTNSGFENKTNHFKTTFPAFSDGSLITVLQGNHRIEEMKGMKMVFLKGNEIVSQSPIKKTAGNASKDQLTYENAFGNGIDLHFKQNSTNRKLDFIIHSKEDIKSMAKLSDYLVFQEDIVLPQGWYVRLVDKQIHVYNNENSFVFKYDKPFAYDTPIHKHNHVGDHESNANHSSHLKKKQSRFHELEYEIIQIGRIVTVKTIVDVNWLLSTERSYPVIIDPTANYTPNATSAWTGTLMSWTGYPGTSVSRLSSDWIGIGKFDDGDDDVLSGWAKFNTAGIPDCASITSAALWYKIYYNATTNTNCTTMIRTRHMANDPASATDANMLTDIRNGTTYSDVDWAVKQTNYENGTGNWWTKSLNASAATDIQNRLGVDWFAVGLEMYSHTSSHANCWIEFSGQSSGADRIFLSVTYSDPSTAPTSITGGGNYCHGQNITLNSTGGTNGSNVSHVWYQGGCSNAFTQTWGYGNPYGLNTTTVNSNTNGILNVTSTSGDPMINMFSLGSFNPAVYRYLNIRYRVVSGTAGSVEAFFLNTTYPAPNGACHTSAPLISDNQWHIATIDMHQNANYTTGGNITGWRYDWCTANGVTMDLDFIQLSQYPMLDEDNTTTQLIMNYGTSLYPPTNATTTYAAAKIDNCVTSCASTTVTLPNTSSDLGNHNDQATCVVNQSGWVHFYHSSGRLLASVNSGGNNLGNVTVTQYDDGAPVSVVACDAPTNMLYRIHAMERHWRITPTNNGAATVRLPFYDSELTSVTTTANANANPNDNLAGRGTIRLSKYSGGTFPSSVNVDGNAANNCTGAGGTGGTIVVTQSSNGVSNATAFPQSISPASGYVDFPITGFSEFWLHGASSSPLPVDLVSFSGTCLSDGILLNWVTASETNNAYFVIERSRDLLTWEEIAQVSGMGNSSQINTYNFNDPSGFGGFYYRLIQIDFNGEEYPKSPIHVSCEVDKTSISVYPNPTNNAFTLGIHSMKDFNEISMEIFDVTGKLITKRMEDLSKGINEFYFNQLLESGTYLIRVSIEGEIQTLRLVVKN